MGEREITALIGPSGCGKSTFLKTLNRMNDLVPNVRIEGDVRLKGEDIFAREMQLTDLRRRVGMVFQKANPFPMSIYDKKISPFTEMPQAARMRDIGKDLKVRRLSWTSWWKAACRRDLSPVGRGEGPPEKERAGPFRRTAAASVHRTRTGGEARSAADGLPAASRHQCTLDPPGSGPP